MRRLARILLNAATVASLVLAAGVCTLWVWSYNQPELLVFDVGPRRVWLTSQHTALGLGVSVGPYRGRAAQTHRIDLPCLYADRWDYEQGWHGVAHTRAWVPALAFAVIPAARLAARTCKRTISRPPGLCHRCGYDLRATPDRCPECGASPPAHFG